MTLFDAREQRDTTAADDWRTVDVPACMFNSHSSDVVIRTVIQRLRINWSHVSPEKLHGILKVVGAPAEALGYIRQVVRGCQARGIWHTPSGETTLAATLSTKINEHVRMDFMFHRIVSEPLPTHPHTGGAHGICTIGVIDRCVRWFAAVALDGGDNGQL